LDITQLRYEYISKGLDEKDLSKDPLMQFEKWFQEALEAKLIEPNAMSLATISKELTPSIRTVLLKIFDKKGFVFFSNYKSQKAKDIDIHPQVCLHFAWLGLERQVKIEGVCNKISKTDSLRYFLMRPKGSQIGSWVSHQSEVITSRSILEMKFDEMKTKYANAEVPFPSFWGGYIVKPQKIEFWQGQKDRLHDRFLYTLQPKGNWKIERLSP
jgi:pyridoxamine 5'-phosphate oxidase